VISAILATLLAIHFGFNAVILLALGCYLQQRSVFLNQHLTNSGTVY